MANDDLLFYENQSPASVPVEDVEEVPHYVAGLQHGIERMRKGLPLSLRLMKESVLYLSLYLKKHRSHYYDLLNKVRADGAWEVGTTKQKIALLKRQKESALKVFAYLQTKAMCSIPQASAALGLSQPTITASLKHLQKLGIAAPLTDKKRDRLFGYKAYLELLSKDTKPILQSIIHTSS